MLFRRDLAITFEAALRDLASDSPRVRAAAADALGDLPEGEDRAAAAAALTRALADPRFEVRRSATLSLGELGALAPIDALAARLEDDHAEVRQAAAIALGRLGDARGFAPLLRALADGPPDVRFQAAPSLVEIDAERAYPPLLEAIADGDAEVRASVATALAMIGDRRAADAIAALLGDRRADTRFEAACALARLGDPRGVDTLLPYVERDPEHAYPAIAALESLRAAQAAPVLARVARKLLAPAPIRVRAAGALLMVDAAHADAGWARAFLERSLRSRRPEVRGLAEEALARLAGEPVPQDDDDDDDDAAD